MRAVAGPERPPPGKQASLGFLARLATMMGSDPGPWAATHEQGLPRPADGRIPGYCTLCRSRCGTLNTVRDGRLVKVEPDPSHPTGHALCAKGRAAPEIVHSTSRLTVPLRRTTAKTDPDPRWREISWEEALAETAERLLRIRAEDGAEAVAFAVTSPSGTPMSDSIDWVERFIRSFGSPNTAYATEICNWHKDFAHAFTFGCGMPTADYAHSDLIVLWGHNPASTWLAQAGRIAEGVARGARLIVVDPRRTGHAAQADHWLQVRPGTDTALALGLVHLMLEKQAFDEPFVRNWTNAPLLVRGDDGRLLRADVIGGSPGSYVVFDAAAGRPVPWHPRDRIDQRRLALEGEYPVGPDDVMCKPVLQRLRDACRRYDPQRVQALTGVPEAVIRATAETLGASRRVSYHAWTGIGQHIDATAAERAVAILYALTGSFDAVGGNRRLTRQPANRVNGLDLLDPRQRAKALGLGERPLGPPSQGWVTGRDLYAAIRTGKPYRVRAMMAFGSNPLLAHADPQGGHHALQSLEFHVHCDLFETPSARYADVLLPVSSPWEREAIRIGFEIDEAAEELVQLRRRLVPPMGQARSDTEIVFDLACRVGLGSLFFDGDIEAGWNHILAPLGLSTAQLRAHPEGIRRRLPQAPRGYAERAERGEAAFATQTERVELYSELLLRHGIDPLPAWAEAQDDDADYPLTLTSAKSGHFCHSQHRSLATLRRRSPDPVVSVHPDTALARGIGDGDWVALRSRAGSARLRARFEETQRRDVLVGDYGWWQICEDLGLGGFDAHGPDGANLNALADTQRCDPVSGSVPMRSIACEMSRDPAAGPLRWTGFRPMRVRSLFREAPGVVSVELGAADGALLPDFLPGQHIQVRIAGAGPGTEASRAYSLSGAATVPDRRSYRITVRRSGEGGLSDYVNDRLVVGDRVDARLPAGRFTLPTTAHFPVVLLASGIGITPFMSYLESVAAQNPAAEVLLIYGNRSWANAAFADRLDELARQWPHLRVLHCLTTQASVPAPRAPFRVGRVDVGDIPKGLIGRRARFYVCGPHGMIAEATRGLIELGVPPFEIFSEAFQSVASAAPIPEGPFDVRFARSGRTLEWRAAAGTLLDLAEAAGLGLPSGCRVGQCGSCAVGVHAGTYAYTGASSDEDGCLTCRAVPTSDLVLDA